MSSTKCGNSPVFTIRKTSLPEQLNSCHQILTTVFHQELNLLGMQIPDGYDPCSVYMQITDLETIVGTYRIVLPNASVGLPIEEVGFDLSQFASEQIYPHQICEMSRLALLKEKRGKIPFSKIVYSACHITAQNNASILIAAILPRNVPLFQRHGFSRIGQPLLDPSIHSAAAEESVIVPMQIRV